MKHCIDHLAFGARQATSRFFFCPGASLFLGDGTRPKLNPSQDFYTANVSIIHVHTRHLIRNKIDEKQKLALE